MSNKLTIPLSDTGEVSDGYHTFNELYEHRHHLFACLIRLYPDISWLSRQHADGSSFDGWFIAGVKLTTGDITYHLPMRLWDMIKAQGAEELEHAPQWDGHTSADVVNSLAKLLLSAGDINA